MLIQQDLLSLKADTSVLKGETAILKSYSVKSTDVRKYQLFNCSVKIMLHHPKKICLDLFTLPRFHLGLDCQIRHTTNRYQITRSAHEKKGFNFCLDISLAQNSKLVYQIGPIFTRQALHCV